MSKDGWIRIYRQLQSHPLWTDDKFSRGQAWLDLLLFASHKTHSVPVSGKVIKVERGQILTSQARLAKRWKWDRKTVRRFLRGLEGARMCHILGTIRGDIGYTLISIDNYEAYQGRNGSRAHSTPHSTPQSVPNQSPISPHNQECKEWKECKEEDGSSSSPPWYAGITWDKSKRKVELTEAAKMGINEYLIEIAEREKVPLLSKEEAKHSLYRLSGHFLRNRMKTGPATLPPIVVNWLESDMLDPKRKPRSQTEAQAYIENEAEQFDRSESEAAKAKCAAEHPEAHEPENLEPPDPNKGIFNVYRCRHGCGFQIHKSIVERKR